jgi:hypothetical protein
MPIPQLQKRGCKSILTIKYYGVLTGTSEITTAEKYKRISVI